MTRTSRRSRPPWFAVALLGLVGICGSLQSADAVCTAPALFGPATSIITGQNPRCVTPGDFNQDGITDLSVTNSYAIATGGAGSNVSILVGQGSGGVGNGTFAPPVNYLAVNEPWTSVTGDFNHDGITDLAVTNLGSGNVSILLGQGSGGVGNGTFAPPINYAAGAGPHHVLAGDFNEDGITDLAVSNNAAASISILRGQGSGGLGDGTFAAPVSYALNNLSTGLASGDFNSDGITDLIATENYSGTIAILLGQGSGGVGNGTFASAVHVAAGVEPFEFAVADFNGDGILDLAVANGSSGGTAILLGNGSGGIGNGSFGPPSFIPSGNSAGLLAADFNGDGITDLAVGYADPYTNGTVNLYLGQGSGGLGNGTFGSPTTYAVGRDPLQIVMGDFNEDGKLDLAVSNYYDNFISVLPGACAADPRSPTLTRVRDVPNDQGGKLFVTWLASSLDVTGGAVNSYRVWRRIPPIAPRSRAVPAGISPLAPLRTTHLARADGTADVVYWEALATLPAQRLQGYGYTAPTTQDSMAGSNPYSAFFITALTSNIDVFYDSQPDSGYSVDNLAPATPTPFAAQFLSSGVALHWSANQEGDLSGYRIHRGGDPNFIPSPANLIRAQPDTGFFDPAGDGLSVYKLAAADIHGNLSAFALAQFSSPTPVEVSLVSAEATADHVALVWYIAGGGSIATIFRSEDGVGWSALARMYADGTGRVAYEDRAVTPGAHYHYRIGVGDGAGQVISGETDVEVPGLELALAGLQPNPLISGGGFAVAFTLPSSEPAALEVFDASGRRVAAREVGSLGPGRHRVSLDDGARLRAGLYLVRLRQTGRVLTARAVVLR